MVRDDSSWKRNIIKRKNSHMFRTLAWEKNQSSVGNCKKQCHQMLNQELRERLFLEFWSTRDVHRQNDFLCNTIKLVPKNKVRHKSHSKSKCSIKYFFKVNDESIQICSKFYVDFLDISLSRTEWALEKSKQYTSGLSGTDQRGKHAKRPNKISASPTSIIKEHINSFPRMESHYFRKKTKQNTYHRIWILLQCTICLLKIVLNHSPLRQFNFVTTTIVTQDTLLFSQPSEETRTRPNYSLGLKIMKALS